MVLAGWRGCNGVQADRGDYDLAQRLEKIRMDGAAWVKGRVSDTMAAYPSAFAEGGFAVLEDQPATLLQYGYERFAFH